MTEEVKFIRGNDRINQLAQRPDIADEVAQVRADMAEADRTYAMGLAALRQAAELTQVELARRMGVTQAAISRMEQPHDLLLSTLNSYLQAIGGTRPHDRQLRRRPRNHPRPLTTQITPSSSGLGSPSGRRRRWPVPVGSKASELRFSYETCGKAAPMQTTLPGKKARRRIAPDRQPSIRYA